jgi:hypothetical protein
MFYWKNEVAVPVSELKLNPPKSGTAAVTPKK